LQAAVMPHKPASGLLGDLDLMDQVSRDANHYTFIQFLRLLT
jgi:hypothetical protein